VTPRHDVLRSVVLTVGDELLLGRTVDGNAAWLGRTLSDLGIPVVKRYTVGDTDEAIQRALEGALTEAELVVVTGGLGPTRDDRTRDAVAALLGAELHVDPELLYALEERFRARGYDRLPETNVTQARVPEGATVLANPLGTAPGLALEHAGTLVVLLPGVPSEMKAIFRGDLTRLLLERFGPRLRPVRHRTFHTTGIAESELASRLEALLPTALGPVTVAFLPELTGVDLRLSVWDTDATDDAERLLDQVEATIGPVLEGFRFQAESGDLVEALSGSLVRSGLRLAVAESCTGGLIAKRITDLPGASSYFMGGVVAYADAVKVGQLGVAPDVLAQHGAVSEQVALGMARGVARLLEAEVGVSVTGVAGPGGGSQSKPVGTVWYAASVRGEATARREVFSGDRTQIRERAAQAALALALREVERRG